MPTMAEKCSNQQSTTICTQEENHPTQCIDKDQNVSIQTIVNELKSIKETILHLGAKIDTSYNDLTKMQLKM